MPFALLMTEVLKRREAGDPGVLKARDRLSRLLTPKAIVRAILIPFRRRAEVGRIRH